MRCGVTVEPILGQRAVEGVRLGSHTHLDAELVVICAGITPNTDLAVAAGVTVGRSTSWMPRCGRAHRGSMPR